MSFVRIFCSCPGLRRAGREHSAAWTWPAETFTDAQLDQLRADPAFRVEEVSDLAVVAEVAAEVKAMVAHAPPPEVFTRLVSEGLFRDISDAVVDALGKGLTVGDFKAIAEEIFTRHGANTPEGRSGTAREAPSADSGSASADGAQPAAPHSIPAPEQPAQIPGGHAQPEPDDQGAPVSGEGASLPAPGTGEASEAVAAVAASDAAPSTELVSHQDDASAVVSQETQAVGDNAEPTMTAKSRRKGK